VFCFAVAETAVPTELSDLEDDVPKDTAAADTLTVVETFMPTEPPDDARIHMRLNELTGILEYCSESDAETVVSNSDSGSSVIEMIPVSVAE